MNPDPAPLPQSREPDPVPDAPSAREGNAFVWPPGADKLIKTHLDPLCRMAFSYVRDWDVADDLAQEAIIRYLKGPPGLSERTLYVPHLRWLALSWLRTQKKHPSVPLNDVLEAIEQITTRGPDALSQLVASYEYQRVKEALDQISAEDAGLLLRYYVHGEPVERIAAELKIGVGAARVRIHRALKRLRAQLDAD